MLLDSITSYIAADTQSHNRGIISPPSQQSLISTKMGAVSKLVSDLPEGYGYVVMVGCVGSTVLNIWMSMNVGRARKRYEVPYPEMYSKTSKEFNCIQRAHQNTLEGQATFLTLLFISGLQYPKLSAGAGAVYLLSRVVFALGYYTGDPNKRKRGIFGSLALLGLLGGTIGLAANQLGWL